MARDQLAMTSQIQHLTTTAAQLRDQMSAQAGVAADAIQHVRDEVSGDKAHGATNAGGDPRPEASTCSSSKAGRNPDHKTPIRGQYTVVCAYCDGDVPKIIAKQCHDCKAHFRPSHYQLHRDEWPCPTRDEDNSCLWCMEPIQEEHAKVECILCNCDLHTDCYSQHMPCPDGWVAK